MGKRDYSVKFGQAELSEFIHEFQNESDRATVLLGAAYLDKLLGKLLNAKIINDEKVCDELLKNPYSPLGSFHSRILSAYGLGLIHSEEFEDLTIIRRIRNDFAHEIFGMTFDNRSVIDLCKNLNLPKKTLKKIPQTIQSSPRSQFIDCVVMLGTFIELRIEKIQKSIIPPKFVIE